MENHHFYKVNHLQMAQFLASYFDIEGRFRCPIMFTTSSFGLIPGFTGESVSVLLRPCLPSPWKCRPSFLSSLPSLPSSFPSCLPSCLPSCFSCSLFWFPFWLLCLPCLGDLLQTFLRFLLLCLTLFPKTLSVSNHCWGLRWCNSMKRISTRNLQIFAMGVPSGIFFFNRFFFRVLDLEIVWGCLKPENSKLPWFVANFWMTKKQVAQHPAQQTKTCTTDHCTLAQLFWGAPWVRGQVQ